MYVISVKLKRTHKLILGIISSLSGKISQVLNDLLRGKFFTRPLTEGIYEVCPCEKGISCNQREFHSYNKRFYGNNINYKAIFKSIDYIVDDIFKFPGKDVHIRVGDMIAKGEKRNFEYNYIDEHSSGPSFWSGIKSSMNPFSWFSSSVGYH